MNWKSTGILLTAAAVAFAFVWLVDRPMRQERSQKAVRAVFTGFDPRAINEIEIKPRGADEIHVTLLDPARRVWQMKQPIVYPAQGQMVDALLAALSVVEWRERITANELKSQPDAQQKFGFTQPQFELSLRGQGAPYNIIIGQSAPMGDGVFVEIVGNPDIYLVPAGLMQFVPSDKDYWRDPGFLNVDALHYETIQARSPGRGFDLELNPTNHLWFMKKPVAARADSARVNELLENIRQLEVRQFISDDPQADLDLYGLQTSPQTPALDLSFLQGTNIVAELQVGAAPTNEPKLVYARRQAPANIVVIDSAPLQPWEGAYTNFLDYHFISESPDDIASIAVQGEGRFTVEKQSGGPWLVHADTTFPADAGLMRYWVASFTNIQTQIEKTVAMDFGDYGLTHPLLQYTLLGGGSSNHVLAQIEFGTNKSGRIFERRPDETFGRQVNAVAAEDFDRLPFAPWQLRDRRIWSFDTTNVLSMTIHQHGQTRKYLRDPEGEWTFAPGFHGPPMVNWFALEEGVHRLGDLHAVYWDGVGMAALKNRGFAAANFTLSLEVARADKSATNNYSIAFGGRSPFSYPYATVEQNGQRLVFEFPVDLYENFVERDMTIPAPENKSR